MNKGSFWCFLLDAGSPTPPRAGACEVGSPRSGVVATGVAGSDDIESVDDRDRRKRGIRASFSV
jgi:hypothetical protein